MDNNKNSIGIYFVGLEVKERAIFDRVIAFNVTHGLDSHICDDIQSSDLVISSEAEFSQYEQNLVNQKVFIVSNDPTCSVGDIQIKRPMLITRVMKALETIIDLVKLVKDQDSIDNDSNEDSQENNEVETAEIVEVAEIPEVSESFDVSEALETNDSTETVSEESKETQSGHHALIIDDSAAIRKQLELELRDAGITADFAESGEQALDKIQDRQYDLVFLDIIMPGIDGYETCRAMRTKASYKRTPIIMLSGKTSPLDEVQGVIAGATTYLTKPVKSAKLQETLSRVTKWLDNYAVIDNSKNSETV